MAAVGSATNSPAQVDVQPGKKVAKPGVAPAAKVAKVGSSEWKKSIESKTATDIAVRAVKARPELGATTDAKARAYVHNHLREWREGAVQQLENGNAGDVEATKKSLAAALNRKLAYTVQARQIALQKVQENAKALGVTHPEAYVQKYLDGWVRDAAKWLEEKRGPADFLSNDLAAKLARTAQLIALMHSPTANPQDDAWGARWSVPHGHRSRSIPEARRYWSDAQNYEDQVGDVPAADFSRTHGLPAPRGQVADWINQAIEELKKLGIPADKLDPNIIASLIQHESGGNPTSVNDWDSNARAGHPSKGLMQCIDSTFRENAIPGHNQDIFDPVSNICAGVNYALKRYGSLQNVPGIRSMAAGGAYRGY
jgi:hypothetical protein